MNENVTPREIARILQLEPLEQEGGLFRSTFHQVDPETGFECANAIYYMLIGDQFSHLHRLSNDEVYHYHMGDALEMIEIRPDGTCGHYLCGPDVCHGQVPQVTMHANCWQGSRVIPGGTYSLVGTVSIPGWTPQRYEHCEICEELVSQHPEWEELIRALCRDAGDQDKTREGEGT